MASPIRSGLQDRDGTPLELPDTGYFLVPPAHFSKKVPIDDSSFAVSPSAAVSKALSYIRRLTDYGPGAYRLNARQVRDHAAEFERLRDEAVAVLVDLRAAVEAATPA